MTIEEKYRFLSYLSETVKETPDVLDEAINACTRGMKEAYKIERDRAIDMELVAVGFQAMSGNKRYSEKNYKWASGLVLAKLQKWPKHCRVNWGDTVDKLVDKKENK